MLFWTFLGVFLVVLLIAVVPVWPYSRRWGYAPTLGAVVVLLAFLVLVYFGYIGPWSQAGPPFYVEEGPEATGEQPGAVEPEPAE